MRRKSFKKTSAKVSLMGSKVMVSILDVSSAFDVRKGYELEHLNELLEVLDKASISVKQTSPFSTVYIVPMGRAVLLKQMLSHKSFLINKRRLSKGVH